MPPNLAVPADAASMLLRYPFVLRVGGAAEPRDVRWLMTTPDHREERTADRKAVCDLLLGGASDLLRQNGSYPPFGAVMKNDGQLSLVATHLHANINTGPREHFDTLIQIFVLQRKTMRAFGICSDVHAPAGAPTGSDGAIQVNVESSDGVAEVFVQPYSAKESFRLFAASLEVTTPIVFRNRRKWNWPWVAT